MHLDARDKSNILCHLSLLGRLTFVFATFLSAFGVALSFGLIMNDGVEVAFGKVLSLKGGVVDALCVVGSLFKNAFMLQFLTKTGDAMRRFHASHDRELRPLSVF